MRVPPSCLAMPADFFAAFSGLIPMFHQCMRPCSGVLILRVSRQTPLECQVILRHVPCNMHMYTPMHAGTRFYVVEMSRVDAQTSSRHTDISECTHAHTYTGIPVHRDMGLRIAVIHDRISQLQVYSDTADRFSLQLQTYALTCIYVYLCIHETFCGGP